MGVLDWYLNSWGAQLLNFQDDPIPTRGRGLVPPKLGWTARQFLKWEKRKNEVPGWSDEVEQEFKKKYGGDVEKLHEAAFEASAVRREANDARIRKENLAKEIASKASLKEMIKNAGDTGFVNGVLKYPTTLTTDEDGDRLPFIRYHPFEYRARGAVKNQTDNPLSKFMIGGGATKWLANQIYLPMTSTLTQNTNPNWAQESDFISRLSAGSNFEKGVFNEDSFTNMGFNALANTGHAGLKAALAPIKMLGGDDLVKSGMRRMGQIMNPFHERFFEGVSFRVYSFEHKFMSSNLDESETIKNIIKRFQYYSLPDIDGNRLRMDYPSLWRIGFFEADCERNQFLPILEDCVVTLVGVVYGGGGSWASLESGEPVEVTLSLQVTEISIPSKRRMMREQVQYQGAHSKGGGEASRQNLEWNQ